MSAHAGLITFSHFPFVPPTAGQQVRSLAPGQMTAELGGNRDRGVLIPKVSFSHHRQLTLCYQTCLKFSVRIQSASWIAGHFSKLSLGFLFCSIVQYSCVTLAQLAVRGK